MAYILSEDTINALIGQKFGKLSILSYAGRDRKYGKILYRCRCDCGNENFVTYRSSLITHHVESCGCGQIEAAKRKLQDLTGQKFNMLTVIKIGPKSSNNSTQWYCLCDCGKETLLRAQDLKNGFTKSCGCLKKNAMEEKNLIGKSFGRLVVISRGPNDKRGCTQWYCDCECGRKDFLVMRTSLLGKRTKSCGCLNKEVLKNNHFRKHGLYTKSPKLYKHYSCMMERCYNEEHDNYYLYGGRGIKVCDRWLGDAGLNNFYNDMLLTWRDGLTLDRIDNNLGYSPQICRWATKLQQNSNRRDNVKFLWNGEMRTLAELGRIYNIPYARLFARVRQLGWSLEESLSTPSQKRK